MKDGFISARPRFWLHVKHLILYPIFLYQFWLRERAAKRLTERWKIIALSPSSDRSKHVKESVVEALGKKLRADMETGEMYRSSSDGKLTFVPKKDVF